MIKRGLQMLKQGVNRCGVCGGEQVLEKIGCYICASCRTVLPYNEHGIEDAIIMNEEFDTAGVDLIMKALGW